LSRDIPDEACWVRADPMALRQILANLAENAVRYTQAGSVTLFATREPHGVRVGVRDTGIGIPPEHLDRIFERFYRVDAARSREEGGTGLGLAIVKHLAEAHGGSVRAESVAGKGSTISVYFPDEPGGRVG
jgi:two-component system phosphate regulon sensor histidine kinase PhoR